MSTLAISNFSDDELLLHIGQQPRGPEAWELIYERFTPLLKRLAQRRASDVDPDDVVAEVWLFVFRTQAKSFDPSRGSARQYLYGVCLNAIRIVRNQTRNFDVSFDAATSRGDGTLEAKIPGIPDIANGVLEHIEVQQLLTAADISAGKDVSTCLRLIYESGMSVSEVASVLGVNRTTLIRHIRRWRDAEIELVRT